MLYYRISYETALPATRNIDLLCGDDGVRIEWRTELNRNISSTGIYENITQNTLRFVSFDCYFQENQFHQLETWIADAVRGVPFSFTKDSTRTPSHPLTADNNGNNNQYQIDTTPTDLSVGEPFILIDQFGTKWDISTITNLDGTYLHAYDNSAYTWSTGDTIYWYYYFPALILLDERFNPDRNGSFWRHTFNCVEVRNGS